MPLPEQSELELSDCRTVGLGLDRGLGLGLGLGRAVQVDLRNFTLKAPGYKPLKLKCDKENCFQVFSVYFQLAPLQRGL